MSTLRKQMSTLTVEALSAGINNSDEMRAFVAKRLGAAIDNGFVNTHAWSLVDLQTSGKIKKVATRIYALAGGPDPEQDRVPAPTASAFPDWARRMVARANLRNGANGPRFTNQDLIAVWNKCDGKCAITGEAFSLRRFGTSLVKRILAPSLDRIQSDKPYTRENCRLVLVAVNFALNGWGEDVYLRLARAAVRNQPA
jgi:hypothetical protein